MLSLDDKERLFDEENITPHSAETHQPPKFTASPVKWWLRSWTHGDNTYVHITRRLSSSPERFNVALCGEGTPAAEWKVFASWPRSCAELSRRGSDATTIRSWALILAGGSAARTARMMVSLFRGDGDGASSWLLQAVGLSNNVVRGVWKVGDERSEEPRGRGTLQPRDLSMTHRGFCQYHS